MECRRRSEGGPERERVAGRVPGGSAHTVGRFDRDGSLAETRAHGRKAQSGRDQEKARGPRGVPSTRLNGKTPTRSESGYQEPVRQKIPVYKQIICMDLQEICNRGI